jgi:hypothetical protein
VSSPPFFEVYDRTHLFLSLFAPSEITEPVANRGYGTQFSSLLIRRRALADPGRGFSYIHFPHVIVSR